jgi:single-stranded DNA-specific DHH superfamily exonuclease
MLDMLKAEARKAAELIEDYSFIRIFTHYDVDGISSAAILASALLRRGKRFHITFLRGLNQLNYSGDELVVLQDMGSGYPDVVSNIDANIIIIDHHYPVGRIEAKGELVHVNPHLSGLDGSFELSASGATYTVVNQLGENADLSGIALLGIIGDKQKIVGGNAEIVSDGIKKGYIEEAKGLSMHSGKVREVLKLSTEPFLDFYGKEDELEEFLRNVRIDGEKEIEGLRNKELQRLANAIVLRLLKQGAYEGIIDDIIGRKFVLKKEILCNAAMLADVVNACGRVAAYSVGLALCLGDPRYLEKGMEIWRKFQIELLEEIQKKRDEIKKGKCIRYLIMNNAPTTAPIATIFSRYLYPAEPIVVVNIKKDNAKISSRTTMKIAEIDLGEIMRKAAEKVGGRGGGHRVAAGANIEPDRVEEFIKEVDRLCCLQG